MPWNDNANSGGKPDKKPGPKPGPWGAPPSGGGGSGGGDDRPPPRRPTGGGGSGGRRRPGAPDVSDLGRQFGDKLRDVMGGAGGGGPSKRLIGLIAAGVVAIWAASGIYIVQSDEEAVITTFGAYYDTTGPGMHYRAPFPFQNVVKVKTTAVRNTIIGGKTGESLEQSLMLTSDENIIDLDFTVQWRVSNARDFTFSLDNPTTAVGDVAESAMREVVGKTPLQALITTQRGQVQTETLQLMQAMLDSYRSGVTVSQVLIDNAGPPPPVVAAFQAVNAAEQEAESVQNLARGEASRIVAAAQGYAAATQSEAEGEAARFNQIYAQYKLAPAVTRDRLYIETMQRVLSRANKVVIDSKGATAPIILPPDAFRPRSTQTAPATASDAARTGSAR